MSSEFQEPSPEHLFPRRFWGYDRAEVEAWVTRHGGLEADPETEPDVPTVEGIGVELAGLGDKVDEILGTARETAAQLLGEAHRAAGELTRESEETAAQLRREADEASQATRKAADEYDAATRAEAETAANSARDVAEADAEAKVAAAEQEAEELLRDARLELSRIEGQIDDLRERRRNVLAGIEEMQGRLSSMIGEVERGTTEFAAAAADLPEDDDFDAEEGYEPEEHETVAEWPTVASGTQDVGEEDYEDDGAEPQTAPLAEGEVASYEDDDDDDGEYDDREYDDDEYEYEDDEYETEESDAGPGFEGERAVDPGGGETASMRLEDTDEYEVGGSRQD